MNTLPITSEILNAACAALATKRAAQEAAAADQAATAAWYALGNLSSAAELAAGRQAALAADNKRRAALGKSTKAARALQAITRAAAEASHPNADRIQQLTHAIALENAARGLAALEA
jgi:hypothetical protein